MKNGLFIGAESDIAKGLVPLMYEDGWALARWSRLESVSYAKWDLCVIALGRVAPVGNWWELDDTEVQKCFESNILLPFSLLKEAWPYRNPNSSVCFFGGSNPQKIMSGYAPYNAAKMSLLKLVEQLDHESPDCKIFALGPGYYRDSKIHKATLEAGWPNERIARGDAGTPIEKIYECLKWCLGQKKEVVGGRNVCASDPIGPQLAALLEANPSMCKLRRIE